MVVIASLLQPLVADTAREFAVVLTVGGGHVGAFGGAATTMLSEPDAAVSPLASATMTVMSNVPAVVGVPEIPPPVFILNPGARLPVATDHVYGPVPPEACNVVWAYAVPMVPPVKLIVVTVKGMTITILNGLVAVSPLASLTSAVKLEVPAAVGIPEITPAPVRLNPGGKLPAVSDHVYAGVPPVAASVWLYATETVPLGRLAVVTNKGVATTMLSDWVAVLPAASATCTVKLLVPAVLGAPEITPEKLKFNPGGRLPLKTDQK